MKKTTWIIVSVVLLLVAVRIALPYIIINVVNNTLENLNGYTGSIEDVDLHIYRGAYQIDSLVIDKVENNNEIPFLSIPTTDISLEWSALFDGAFVGEVELINPELNFVAPNQDEGEFGNEVDWVQVLKDINPFRINRFAVRNGSVHYRDFSSDPQVNLPLHELNVEVLNITNAEDAEQALPTSLKLNAVSVGGGSLNISGSANMLMEIPDMDVTLEFENVNLPDLNEFLKAYAKVDAENGVFNLYSEFAVNDAQLEGYFKPVLDRVKILSLENEKGNVLQKAWEGVVAVVSELFENQPENQFATEVPLQGNLENVDVGVVPAIWNILRNAFVEAFEKTTEGKIKFSKVGDDEEAGTQKD